MVEYFYSMMLVCSELTFHNLFFTYLKDSNDIRAVYVNNAGASNFRLNPTQIYSRYTDVYKG